MFSGRILKRCSACNKPLHQRLPGLKLNALSMVIWVLLANWMTKGIEGPMGIMILVVAVFFYLSAERRIYHAIWYWRHPVRCQGGGHAAPLPEAS